ncbi:hypothetical protein DFQ28_011596 [Apophysomyces sp. BC1034]|nr:hypothetical protein DFQ30_005891 [Apophysomyces sp. BC1015]KAG0181704.1 hypothetical protein DFQ29_007370 [Apophysomyces sp. BC1021]KAG0191554.1 hypothetical protein DFQ28_011596 [Apophysomyces sp. BC1034]
MSTVSLSLTSEEIDTLREAFQIYGGKNAGIAVTEFAKVLQSLCIASDPSQIQSIIRSVDCNGDNIIDFNEFVVAMVGWYLSPLTQQTEEEVYSEKPKSRNVNKRTSYHELDEVTECFLAFDKNHDGRITKDELEDVLIRLGERPSPQEIKDMMNEADTNKDGFIDFDEFKQLFSPSVM